MTFDLDRLVRPNIRTLVPYSSARTEFTGHATAYLDANENSLGSPVGPNYLRYPDPEQSELKRILAAKYGIETGQVFVGNGSDEAIDLLVRVFCRPGCDRIVICPPTYGMYEVAAAINDVEVMRVDLKPDFQLDVDAILDVVDETVKLMFVCSPNNPTGNSLVRDNILRLAAAFDGIVVVDEAYVHFSNHPSLVDSIARVSNLVVLQTLSKAWGLAGIRVGFLFGSADIVELLTRVKPPYNVSSSSQELALAALKHETGRFDEIVQIIMSERQHLAEVLPRFPFVREVYASDANFLLVRVDDSHQVYKYLVNAGIVVRDRSKLPLCDGCLRITVGSPPENTALIAALEKYEEVTIHRP